MLCAFLKSCVFLQTINVIHAEDKFNKEKHIYWTMHINRK